MLTWVIASAWSDQDTKLEDWLIMHDSIDDQQEVVENLVSFFRCRNKKLTHPDEGKPV